MANVRIAILGAGAHGTALGMVLCGGVPGIRAGKSRSVILWTREPEVVAEIRDHRLNTRYLNGVTLPRALRATTGLEQAVAGADIILIAVPCSAVHEVSTRLGTLLAGTGGAAPDPATMIFAEPVIVGTANGIEAGSFRRMSQVIAAAVPERIRTRILALSGPALARDLCRGAPTAVVLAGPDAALARAVRRQLQTPILRIQVSRDVAGVELGGLLKNAYSLALGLCDGLGLGLNTKAAIVSRALPELARLGVAFGGRRATFYGLAGLGDLLGTGLSGDSRNRKAGEELALRQTPDATPATDPGVIEGIGAVRTATKLAALRGMRLPLLEGIAAVLDRKIDPLKMIVRLVG